MRVLVIHTQYKLRGGEDTVVANEIELLRASNIKVELLTFNNTRHTAWKLMQMPFNFRAYRSTKKVIQSFLPDIVHVHNLHFSGSASVIYAIKQSRKPLVMTLHNYRLLCPSGSLFHNNALFLDSVEGGFPWSAVKKGVYQNSRLITFWTSLSMYLHEKLKTWDAVDQFILLGEHSKELFTKSRLRQYQNRMVVKPNFCAPAPVLTGLEKKSFYLYIGRLTEEKGLPVLLKAFASNHLPLKIVGTGPLQNLVKEYENKFSTIQYLGEQSKDQIYALLDQASALIFPSLWFETFGMVVIEAFSKSVPVITSDLGNMKALVTDGFNGLTFKANDTLELNKKVMEFELMSNENKSAMQKNALATYLKNYTPKQNIEQLKSIYKVACDSQRDHLKV